MDMVDIMLVSLRDFIYWEWKKQHVPCCLVNADCSDWSDYPGRLFSPCAWLCLLFHLCGFDYALADEFWLRPFYCFENVVNFLWCVECVWLDARSFSSCSWSCSTSSCFFWFIFFHDWNEFCIFAVKNPKVGEVSPSLFGVRLRFQISFWLSKFSIKSLLSLNFWVFVFPTL